MKIWLTLFWLACLGWCGSSSLAQPVTIFSADDFPPVIHLQDGKPAGALSDVLKRVEQQSGIQFQLILLPWKRAYLEAEQGNGGIIGLSKNTERLTIFDYSDVVYNNDILIVTHRQNPLKFDTLADLYGKKIGIQIGVSYGDDFAAAVLNNKLQVAEVGDVPHRLRLLLAGQVDGVLGGNELRDFALIAKNDPFFTAHRDELMLLPKPFAEDPLFLGFAKKMNMQPFLERFNAALKAAPKGAE